MAAKDLKFEAPIVEFMEVCAHSTRTAMNQGKVLFTLEPDQQVRSVVRKMGWVSETHGPMLHGFEAFCMQYGVTSMFIDWVNKRRLAAS